MLAEEKKLRSSLDEIIGSMKKVQAKIAADLQPVSMHELGKLEKLGRQYRQVLTELARFAEKDADNA